MKNRTFFSNLPRKRWAKNVNSLGSCRFSRLFHDVGIAAAFGLAAEFFLDAVFEKMNGGK